MRIRSWIIGLLCTLLIPYTAVSANTVPRASHSTVETHTQNEVNKTIIYMRSLGLPVPDVQVRIVKSIGDGLSQYDAAAYSKYVLFTSDAAERISYEPKFLDLDTLSNRILIIHELVHEIYGAEALTSATQEVYDANHEDEEGVAEALSYDLVMGYFKYYKLKNIYGIRMETLTQDAFYSSYMIRNRLMSARLASTRGWHNRAAFNIRVKFCLSDFTARRAMMAQAGLPDTHY